MELDQHQPQQEETIVSILDLPAHLAKYGLDIEDFEVRIGRHTGLFGEGSTKDCVIAIFYYDKIVAVRVKK